MCKTHKSRSVSADAFASRKKFSFGKMMRSSWNIHSGEQVLSHSTGLKVPIELQNRSVVVQGWIRVLSDAPQSDCKDASNVVRAVKAGVTDDLRFGLLDGNLTDSILG